MRRSWNWTVWAGFGVALLAAFSYIPIFSRFPSTRDFPWVNLLLFLAAGCLLATGVHRAFAQAGKYRGRINGTVISLLSFILFGLFCFGVFETTAGASWTSSESTVGFAPFRYRRG